MISRDRINFKFRRDFLKIEHCAAAKTGLKEKERGKIKNQNSKSF